MAGGKRFIEALKIQDFKSFENLEIRGLSHFNLFLGHNNIGKTSVLETIAISTGFHPDDFFNNFLIETRRMNISEIEGYQQFFHRFMLEKPFSISITSGPLDGEKSILKYEFSYIEDRMAEKDKIRVSLSVENLDENEKENRTSWEVSIKELDVASRMPLAQNLLETMLQNAIAQSQREVETHFTEDMDKYNKITDDYVPIVRFIQNNTVLSAKESRAMRDRETRQKVLNFICTIDPDIEEIQAVENSLDLYYNGMNKPFSFSAMGSGFIKILKLYLAILTNEVDVILFDEITDGLSPQTIDILLEEILPLVVEHNIQLFASTHSWDILDCIATSEGVKSDSLAIYKLSKIKSGDIQAEKIPVLTIKSSFPDFIDFREDD